MFSNITGHLTSWFADVNSDLKSDENVIRSSAIDKSENLSEVTNNNSAAIYANWSDNTKHLSHIFSSVVNKASLKFVEAGDKLRKSMLENESENISILESSDQKSHKPATLLWHGFDKEESLKKDILSLSLSAKNFTRGPPDGVSFSFNMEDYMSDAVHMLEEDPCLKNIRYSIVPKYVSEEKFWRNYFYRISIIKNSYKQKKCELKIVDLTTSNTLSTSSCDNGYDNIDCVSNSSSSIQPSSTTNRCQLDQHNSDFEWEQSIDADLSSEQFDAISEQGVDEEVCDLDKELEILLKSDL